MKPLTKLVAIVVVQLLMVNGCLWVLARCFGTLPFASLNGLVFLFVVPIAAPAFAMYGALRISGESQVRAQGSGMFALLAFDATTLWLAMTIGVVVGVHEHQQLRVGASHEDVVVARAGSLGDAGYIRFRDARVDWEGGGHYQRQMRSSNDTGDATLHHDVVFPIRAVAAPGAPAAAWLCVGTVHADTASKRGALKAALVEFRAEVESSGVVGGIVIHDPHDQRDCGYAIDDAEERGVLVADGEPLLLVHAASRDGALAELGARVELFTIIVNVIWVLTPVLLELRALWRRRRDDA